MAVEQMLEYNPQTVQGVSNIIFYILAGLIGLVVLCILVWKIVQRFTYNYSVFVYRKIGNSEVIFEDGAKQVKLDDNYFFHYRGLGKYSPVITSQYMRLRVKKFLGIFSKSVLCFNVYQAGESIFPIAFTNNDQLKPINIDLFNYMQSRIKANQQKYQKNEMLMRILPYVAIFFVMIAFIMGSFFWGQHVENVAKMIMEKAASIASKTLETAGAGQVVKAVS